MAVNLSLLNREALLLFEGPTETPAERRPVLPQIVPKHRGMPACEPFMTKKGMWRQTRGSSVARNGSVSGADRSQQSDREIKSLLKRTQRKRWKRPTSILPSRPLDALLAYLSNVKSEAGSGTKSNNVSILETSAAATRPPLRIRLQSAVQAPTGEENNRPQDASYLIKKGSEVRRRRRRTADKENVRKREEEEMASPLKPWSIHEDDDRCENAESPCERRGGEDVVAI